MTQIKNGPASHTITQIHTQIRTNADSAKDYALGSLKSTAVNPKIAPTLRLTSFAKLKNLIESFI